MPTIEFDNEVVSSIETIEKTIKSDKAIPEGYIPISLSSKGQLGAPSLIHVRNFSTNDIVNFSLASNELLPKRLIHTLNSCILEAQNKETNVAYWTEDEVTELMIRIYSNFYKSKLMNIEYYPIEEDITYMEEKLSPEQFTEWKHALDTGNKKYYIDLDLNKDINILPIEDSFSSTISVRNIKNDFSVIFSIPKIGDSLLVKEALQKQFAERDKTFSSLKKRLEKDEYIDPIELEQFEDYEIEKSNFAIKLSQALYIININGKDLHNIPLKDKIEYCSDARLDDKLYKQVEKKFSELKYGIDPNVTIINPITHKECVRRFNFRELVVLSCLQPPISDEYDIRFIS